jgi:hypothetical protein
MYKIISASLNSKTDEMFKLVPMYKTKQLLHNKKSYNKYKI